MLKASEQRGLQDDVRRAQGLEQTEFFHVVGYANELFVEGHRHGRVFAKSRHVFFLTGFDGLLNRMELVLGQALELFVGGISRKRPVGIYPQGNLRGVEMLAHVPKQPKLLVKVDGADFELEAGVASFEFFFDLPKHLVGGSHPDQAVDFDRALALAEVIVKNLPLAAIKKVEKGCFKTKTDRRKLVAHELVNDDVEVPAKQLDVEPIECPTVSLQNIRKIGQVVGAQTFEGAAFAQAKDFGLVGIVNLNEVGRLFRENTPRRPGFKPKLEDMGIGSGTETHRAINGGMVLIKWYCKR